MASEILKRDQNSAVVLGGVTDDSLQEIRMLRVDPVTGRLLVSPSGGTGGFTTIDATEIPNGVRTVFTFPTATGQPAFIVSDNAMMRATTANGTVNWTWNAGTLEATMTIPPNEDIVGIES